MFPHTITPPVIEVDVAQMFSMSIIMDTVRGRELTPTNHLRCLCLSLSGTATLQRSTTTSVKVANLSSSMHVTRTTFSGWERAFQAWS